MGVRIRVGVCGYYWGDVRVVVVIGVGIGAGVFSGCWVCGLNWCRAMDAGTALVKIYRPRCPADQILTPLRPETIRKYNHPMLILEPPAWPAEVLFRSGRTCLRSPELVLGMELGLEFGLGFMLDHCWCKSWGWVGVLIGVGVGVWVGVYVGQLLVLELG